MRSRYPDLRAYHARLSELFLRLRDLEPEERREALCTECEGDPELLADLESLLRFDDSRR